MDDFSKLFILNKVARRIENFWSDFEHKMMTDRIGSVEQLQDFLHDNRGITGIGSDDYERIYELIKYNLRNLENGTLTKENFVNPPRLSFDVEFQQDYTEWGYEYGSNLYKAADADLAKLFASYDEYVGDFNYDFDERNSTDYESTNFVINGVSQRDLQESIKKSIKQALKEQYSIFIKKHI